MRILGPGSNKNRAPIISIMPLNKSVKEVYAALTQHSLMPGFGDFYAVGPLMDMDIPTDPGVIRISFVHYTSREEVELLIGGLESAL